MAILDSRSPMIRYCFQTLWVTQRSRVRGPAFPSQVFQPRKPVQEDHSAIFDPRNHSGSNGLIPIFSLFNQILTENRGLSPCEEMSGSRTTRGADQRSRFLCEYTGAVAVSFCGLYVVLGAVNPVSADHASTELGDGFFHAELLVRQQLYETLH